MRLRPLGSRVVVRPLQSEEKTPSGIIIPDTAKEKPKRGEVIAVGSGKRLKNGKTVPLDVMVGDKVIFSEFAGDEVEINGEKYLIMDESDILAIV
ncbi:MAG TPA: co-chaperone GroES [Calditrichae bacterium]|nr:co-chaperone GroES [Calditrichia bacterium]